MMWTILLTVGLAQSPIASAGAEFPPADLRVWQLEEQGRRRKEEAKRIARDPSSPEAFRALMELGRTDEGLEALRRLIEKYPSRIAEVMPTLWSSSAFSDGTRDYLPRLHEILAAAHQQAARLPREEAAATEYQLLSADGMVEPDVWRRVPERQDAFINQYAGTNAAIRAQIDRATRQPYRQRLEALDAIAQAHPNTDAAAQALLQKALQLGHNAPVTGPDLRPDPTERFLQVIDIANELESGAYPRSEWVTRAPSLVFEFYSYKPQYAAANVDRMLDAYGAYINAHFAPDPAHLLDNGAGYAITNRMADLFKLKGDADGVDRTLRGLERDPANADAARYMRALYAVRFGDAVTAADRDAGRRKASVLLEAQAAKGDGIYARRALATLASLQLEQRSYTTARDHYRQYVERYPQSPYAWVAALHAGEAEAALGDWKTAEQSFRQAARVYSSNPMAVILGHALTARSLEAQKDPEGALAEYAASVGAWDADFGPEVSLYTTFRDPATGRGIVDSPRIDRLELASRVTRMRASLAQPGGALLERGRWLLGARQRDAAVTVLRELADRFPRSSLVPEARMLRHRAQLESALDLANIERPGADPAAAAAALDVLSREPSDAVISAAKIARATMMWNGGDPAAETMMSAALKEWLGGQTLRDPKTDLEKDVAAIREAVFLPLGGAIYGGARSWNAFDWPATLPSYLLVNPEVPVKLPSGEVTKVFVARAIPAAPNVLYADAAQIALLDMIIGSLGGTKRRQPAQIMETPNQPVGESMNIQGFWNRFFPTRPGHWSGWVFLSYPTVTRIEFLDAAHTRAAANVTVGYSGATVVLEKQGSTWRAVKLTNQWIT